MLLLALCLLCIAPALAVADESLLLQDPSDLDLSFGAAGRIVGVPDGAITDLREDGEGRFVAAGLQRDPSRVAVFRHLPGGLPDPSFGVDGRVLHQLGLGPQPGSGGIALVLQDDGGIVVGGGASYAGGDGRQHALLTRLREDGDVDGSFGSGGTVRITPPDATMSWVGDAVEDGEGRLVVAVGASRDGGEGRRVLIMRFSRDGLPDPGFGEDGTVDLGAGTARRIAAATGGGLLVAHHTPGVVGFEVTRLTDEGAPDESFGDEGRVVVPLPAPEDPEMYGPRTAALALRDDGSILLAGTSADPVEPPDWNTGGVLTVVRLTPAGDPDPAFGADGVATLPADPEHRTWTDAVSVAEDPAGKVVVVGNVSSHVVAGRLLADGTADPAFGDGGVRRRQLVPGDNNILGEIVVRDGGQILIGGYGGTIDACCSPALIQLRGGDVPDTLLDGVPGLHLVTSTVRFVLGAVPATGLFECRLDGGPWEPCGPVVELKDVPNGDHVFEARAVTPGGLVDAEGVRYEFVVDAPPAEPPVTEPPVVVPPVVTPPVPPRVPGNPTLPGGVVDGTAPGLRLTIASTLALPEVLRRGIGLETLCSEACTFGAELRLPPPVARRQGLGSRAVVIGRVVRSLHARSAARLRLKILPRYRRRLDGPLAATLTTRAVDAAGNASVARRTLRLRRR
ncbi:MAG TPA: hypothetical protein VGW10_11470 [Solirubrobacteraceae bacterium]|nr:hypothetical protein [Solirubrobacteraceae bacterium]